MRREGWRVQAGQAEPGRGRSMRGRSMSAGPFGLRLAADHQSELRQMAVSGSPAPSEPGSEVTPPRSTGRRAALRRPVGHLLIRAGRWVAGPDERVVEPRSGGLASLP